MNQHIQAAIPADEFSPPPEEVIQIEGTKGESVFYQLKAWCVSEGFAAGVQNQIDTTLEQIKDVGDDRLLVLVGALLVENGVQELLSAIMPGYEAIPERDFSFSMHIEIARALRLIPNKILNNADLIRKLRNTFVHKLEIVSLAQLDPGLLQSMRDRLTGYVPKSLDRSLVEDPAESFRLLVLYTSLGLHVYVQHVAHLNRFLHSPAFPRSLQAFIEQDESEHGMRLSRYETKFANLIDICQRSVETGGAVVVIERPQDLGSDYFEIVESLNRLATAKAVLQIGHWAKKNEEDAR